MSVFLRGMRPSARRLLVATVLPVLLLPAAASAAIAPPRVDHQLRVVLNPEDHRIDVEDRMQVPATLVDAELRFSLNETLAVRCLTPGITLREAERAQPPAGEQGVSSETGNAIRTRVYRVVGAQPGKALTLDLAYAGQIHHPVNDAGTAEPGAVSATPGLIEAQGVYLAGSSHWVPEVGDALFTYRLEAVLPAGWSAVSAGEREAPAAAAGSEPSTHPVWREVTPAEQVFLVAGRFTEYAGKAGRVKTLAFLRSPEQALAQRYLEATVQYLGMYEAAFGPYPYGTFALVENYWQSGFGMPGFTLLGDRILRFPFILTSSYPHELLHNWWGNGVFVDAMQGNWCEGLTAYLADHLLAEQQGRGARHRRDLLERISDYVTASNDFPLHDFRARSDGVTEAIGYGKAAMMWHMLRNHLGDAVFLEGLRRFYRDQLFHRAGFEDLRRAFEAVSGQSLAPFFRQWVDGTGVPELALTAASPSGRALTLTLAQHQPGIPLELDVPVAVQTAAGVEMHRVGFATGQASVTARFDLLSPALRVEVDPRFDVYRRLDPGERPVTLSRAYATGHALVVLASKERPDLHAGLVRALRDRGAEVIDDTTLQTLPSDRPVWILGRSNRLLPQFAEALRGQGVSLDGQSLHVPGAGDHAEARSLVVVGQTGPNPAAVAVHVAATSAAAADGLARKLPHYGKYSWLVFQGDAPQIEAEGEWDSEGSPLVRVFASGTPRDPPAAAPALLPPPSLRVP